MKIFELLKEDPEPMQPVCDLEPDECPTVEIGARHRLEAALEAAAEGEENFVTDLGLEAILSACLSIMTDEQLDQLVDQLGIAQALTEQNVCMPGAKIRYNDPREGSGGKIVDCIIVDWAGTGRNDVWVILDPEKNKPIKSTDKLISEKDAKAKVPDCDKKPDECKNWGMYRVFAGKIRAFKE